MTGPGRTPEWVPRDGKGTFASSVRDGVDGSHDGMPGGPKDPGAHHPGGAKRRSLRIEEYVDGVRSGDRVTLGRTITLVESNAVSHAAVAQQVLTRLLPFTGNSLRVGITGVPGAGKSTFIEALGCHLTAAGHRVAVLAIDPSSSITKGSVLGDKTRMERLARDPMCFIRPSPSGGTLGGVTRKTRESMLVCEAAGFDVILVETVGVGQSEIAVRSMVDFFLLLLITGAGDDLQGIKKGVMELADAVVINKADGENRLRAEALRADTARALHFFPPATEGWHTPVLTCSSLHGEGIAEVWNAAEEFRASMSQRGIVQQRRSAQMLDWMRSMIDERLRALFSTDPEIQHLLPAIERAVASGSITAAQAAEQLLSTFEQRHHRTSHDSNAH
jgi:LAO/AO transport system kinase